jgi:hypothetical protein
MRIRTTFIATITVGAALLAPVAQAQRPDDRAGARGPGAIDSSQTAAVTHPDDRAGARGPGAVDAQRVGVQLADPKYGQPDRNAYVPFVTDFPKYEQTTVQTSDHPDNRAGARGPGAISPGLVDAPGSSAFDWGDALIGGLVGAGMALLLSGCAFLLTSQRYRARTA